MSRELKKQKAEDVLELLRQGWILEHRLHPYVFDIDDPEPRVIESASIWSANFLDRRTVNMNIFRAVMRRGVLEEVKRFHHPYLHGTREFQNTEIHYRLLQNDADQPHLTESVKISTQHRVKHPQTTIPPIRMKWERQRMEILSTGHPSETYVDYLEKRVIECMDVAVQDVIQNADENAHKKPNMRTLWEEMSEATLSWRGKHEHPLRLELMQLAGICINMMRQIDAGEDFKP